MEHGVTEATNRYQGIECRRKGSEPATKSDSICANVIIHGVVACPRGKGGSSTLENSRCSRFRVAVRDTNLPAAVPDNDLGERVLFPATSPVHFHLHLHLGPLVSGLSISFAPVCAITGRTCAPGPRTLGHRKRRSRGWLSSASASF